MAFCTNCGHKLADGAKFCFECGAAANGSKVETPKQRTLYDGNLHKCPSCGEVINSFVTICPTCNYEFRGLKPSSSIEEFAKKIEQIELQRATNNSLLKGLTNKIGGLGKIHPIDSQKISLIRSFAIPNTKEDIYEFMILASSNIEVKYYNLTYHGSQLHGMLVASQKAVSDAWLAKFEQVYQKAKIVFGSSPDLTYLDSIYKQKKRALLWAKIQFPVFVIGAFLFIFLFIYFLAIIP